MYEILMHTHLWTISPCVLLGAYLLGFPKGTSFHKRLGKGYMFLMFFSSFISLFLEAQVGPQFLNHFGWIHILSVVTMGTVPVSIFAVRNGNIKRHQRTMVLLYFTGLLVAGGFTLFPGRLLHRVFFA